MPKKKKGKRRAKSSDKVPALGGASPEPAAERGEMREAAQARAALEKIRAAAQAHKTEMAAAGSASDGSFVGSGPSLSPSLNTKGYSSTYLAMELANVRAGTWCKRVLEG